MFTPGGLSVSPGTVWMSPAKFPGTKPYEESVRAGLRTLVMPPTIPTARLKPSLATFRNVGLKMCCACRVTNCRRETMFDKMELKASGRTVSE